MLRFLFIVLLLANAAAFAYHQGQLDELISNGREPARLQRQLNADRIRLVDPEALQTAAAPALPGCVEVGNFTSTQARRLEPRLAELVPGQELVRREIMEASSHMVLLPPQESRHAAEQHAAQLRELGITDFYILQESSPHRWGISLGVFKNEEGARAHLASVTQQGVNNAQIVEHSMAMPQVAFQLRGDPEALNAAVDKWLTTYPRYERRACE
jgi:hypothetical protein